MSHTELSDAQIRTMMFEIPDVGLVLAYGSDIANQVIKARHLLEAHGHELRFFGWPDGTTISWERTEPPLPLDTDGIVAAYKRFQETVRPLMEAQHGSD